jgi:hypothetical protein
MSPEEQPKEQPNETPKKESGGIVLRPWLPPEGTFSKEPVSVLTEEQANKLSRRIERALNQNRIDRGEIF